MYRPVVAARKSIAGTPHPALLADLMS